MRLLGTFFCLQLFWQPEAAYAWCVGTQHMTIPVRSALQITGAADANPVGQQISNWGGQVTDTMAFAIDTCSPRVYRSYAVPTAIPVPGLTHTSDGVTYPIYKSNVPGVGYVIGLRDPNATKWTGINAPETQIYPAPGTITGEAPGTLGFVAQVKFIAIGRIKPGVYSGGGEQVATLRVTSASGTQMATTVPLYVQSFTLTATTTSCRVTQGAQQTVNLPAVTAGSFNAHPESRESASFSLSLSCDAGVSVYATMTDASNPTNTEDFLKLGIGSTASGVGIRIFKNGEANPVKFGPDSSAIGNLNQWYVGRSNSNNTPFVIPFLARYYKTSDKVGTGSVRASSTITFSYQ
ncbi:fimbrial protein [Pseudomonas aeruginosa]